MKPFDPEWIAAIANTIGKNETEVLDLIHGWWNTGMTLPQINAELIALAKANGKTLILVDSTDN